MISKKNQAKLRDLFFDYVKAVKKYEDVLEIPNLEENYHNVLDIEIEFLNLVYSLGYKKHEKSK